MMIRQSAKTISLTLFLLLSLGMFFFSACGTTTESSDSSEKFYIFPSALRLTVGEKRQFYFLSVSGGTISPVSATFSLSGNVGRISSAGLFSAEAAGEGTIYAVYTGTAESALVTVEAE